MTEPASRLILSVPFPQKDQAKALGARWDQSSKVWWIPATVDPAPFARWLQQSPAQKPLFQDLAPVDREEVEELGTTGQLEVVFVPWTCWKCHRTTTAFHGAVDRAREVTPLFYQARVLEELDRIRKQLALDPFGCVKPRFSRTLGQPYVSQGCSHCDALIGSNPLWEDFAEVFSAMQHSAFPHCRSLSWSLLGAT